MKEEKYFLQDTRTIVGNCLVFWRKESKGYTTNLDDAELFTIEEALSHRSTDRPWPESLMRSLARPMVDHQLLPDRKALPAELRTILTEKGIV